MDRSRPQRSTAARPPAPGAAPPPDHLHSGWIALGVLVALIPTLARSPQSGDGAEVVATALRGGVLHPTGFPLQAWLDRLIVLVPGPPAAFSISFLGLAAHAGACFFVAETLRLLGVGAAGRLLGAAAFALFPPLWGLAVQPEVFSLAHLLIAAAIFAAVRLAGSRASGTSREAVAVGLLGALCAAQHPVAVAALPALIACAGSTLRVGRRRGARTTVLAAALILPAAAFYLSLPLLRTASAWPDWGALHSPAGVLRHALRMDYGTFSFSAADQEATRSALGVWWRDAVGSWGPALALTAIGLISTLRRPAFRPVLAPALGAFAIGVAILLRARLPEQSYSDAYLSKLQGPVTLAGALWIGLGIENVRGLLRRPGWRRSLDVAVALGVAAWLALGWPRADMSRDRTLDLYTRGLAMELSDSAVYVTEGEVETTMGVPSASGTRFPVSAPVGSLRWYSANVAPRLEPRLADVSVEDWNAYLAAGFSRNLVFAASSPSLIGSPAAVPELRGLLYVAAPGAVEELTLATVSSALRLAPLAEELPLLPARGHEFSRFYARRFARAYSGAAEALRRRGHDSAAAAAESVASAIHLGYPPQRRVERLHSFLAQARAAGFDR